MRIEAGECDCADSGHELVPYAILTAGSLHKCNSQHVRGLQGMPLAAILQQMANHDNAVIFPLIILQTHDPAVTSLKITAGVRHVKQDVTSSTQKSRFKV